MTTRRAKGLTGFMATGAGLACTTAFAQVNNPEVEDNNSKAAANVVNSGGPGMASGDTITGTCTGASTSVPGVSSADYFRVRTALAVLGVYRHQLILNWTSRNIGTIRGLDQADGVIGTADSTVQLSINGMVQWYGFGKGEEIYYRVTGTNLTAAPYTATLDTTPVNVIDLPGFVYEGLVRIETASNSHDTDFWVYDADLNPLPDFGNDNESIAGGGSGTTTRSRCTRNLAPGTYYLAISLANLANNRPSPSDDNQRSGLVLDFPNAAACSTATIGGNLSFWVSSIGSTFYVPANTTEAFGIRWFRFVVLAGVPTSPVSTGSVDIVNADNCGRTYATFRVAVTPGTNPPSTALGVRANFFDLGGAWDQPMFDDGTNGDAVPGDKIFSFRQLIDWRARTGGIHIPYRVFDAQGRDEYNSIGGLTVASCTSFGACCISDTCHFVSVQQCEQSGGAYQGDGTTCGVEAYSVATDSAAFEDISGSGTRAAAVSNCDDCVEPEIPIGFYFTLFDYTSNTISISSNGNLQFTSSLTNFDNTPIPSPGTPNNMIAPLWDDFDTTIGSGEVYYLTRGSAPNREFVVSWQNVAQYNNTDANSFQVVLAEGSNTISFRYGSLTPEAVAGDYSVGIENFTGTVGYSIPDESLGAGNRSFLFTFFPAVNPCTPDCPWSATGCIADFNGSGGTPDDADIYSFFQAWTGGDVCADINASGSIPDDADVATFFELWNNPGC